MLDVTVENLKIIDEMCDRILEKQQKILSFQKEIQSLLDSGLTQRAADVCPRSPVNGPHAWYESGDGVLCEYCGTRR